MFEGPAEAIVFDADRGDFWLRRVVSQNEIATANLVSRSLPAAYAEARKDGYSPTHWAKCGKGGRGVLHSFPTGITGSYNGI